MLTKFYYGMLLIDFEIMAPLQLNFNAHLHGNQLNINHVGDMSLVCRHSYALVYMHLIALYYVV